MKVSSRRCNLFFYPVNGLSLINALQCDEIKPICGPCSKGQRSCVYEATDTNQPAVDVNDSRHNSLNENNAAERQRHLHHASFSSTTDLPDAVLQSGTSEPVGDDPMQLTSPRSSYSASTGYGTDAGALRWFGLLAYDAADVSLDLPALDGPSALKGYGASNEDENLNRGTSQEAQTSPKTAAPRARMGSNSEELKLWQVSEPVQLKDHEHDMFQRFVNGISQWIDLFDPMNHFSTLVPHLALQNEGLMRAVLALGARHLSIKPLPGGEGNVERTAAVQYYYETLQYLQSAMRYTSYKNSLELLATVLVVSTYEMIDGASKGWERHLKGVFWIQRSRDINGESGGLEQAIWWAWLRQDLWAAFRERRRCFSFFKPTKTYRVMDMWDMAARTTYILAQAVNYSSDEEKQQVEANLNGRVARAKELHEMLDEWRRSVSVHFKPLPMDRPTDQVFKPIWIHPAPIAASLQMYSMARILMLIHEPATGGYLEYMTRDKAIVECVDTIGGIALHVSDDASRVMSTQCLFAAGLYCTDEDKRKAIAALIENQSSQTGWPTNTDLADELRREWAKTPSK